MNPNEPKWTHDQIVIKSSRTFSSELTWSAPNWTRVDPSEPKWTHDQIMIKSWRTYSSNLIWNEPEWTQVTPAEPKQAQVNPSSNYGETTTHFLFRINSVHLHAKQYQSTIKAKQSQVNPSEAKRRQAELSMYMCTLCNCLLCRTYVSWYQPQILRNMC